MVSLTLKKSDYQKMFQEYLSLILFFKIHKDQKMKEDGDEVPQWWLDGDYKFEYNLADATTVLRAYEPYVSLAAISRATGINQHLLSHYANGIKQPRPQQRQRIVDGIHRIGRELLAVV